MITTIMTVASLVFLAGPVQQPDGGRGECLFSGDCLRHAFGRIHALSFGKCASRSAWRERYVHTTPDERVKMWNTRHQIMSDRIMRAYRLDDPQKRIVREVFEDYYAVRRESMGDKFAEMVKLRRQERERLRENIDEYKREKQENPAAKLMPLQDDPVLVAIDERLREINKEHPLVWTVILDRIDKVLPKEQAERGRERLAEQYPLGFAADGSQKITIGKPANRGREASLDRWRAYFKKFVVRHELAAGQASAAKSILDEVSERAALMTRRMKDEIARYQADDDAKTGNLIAEAFQFDLDDLFDEFTVRLDAILTTSQRDR